MDSSTRANYYVYYQKNIKLIEIGINTIQRDIKATYIKEYITNNSSSQDRENTINNIKKEREAYTRILSGIIVSWSEQILKRLILEPNAFKPEQIDNFYLLQDARQKWTLVLKLAFCNKFISYQSTDPLYTRISKPENITSLNRSLRLKYKEVHDLIKNEIFPSIDLRNKVQHGEWKIAFTPPNSIIKDDTLTIQVNKQNIRTLQTLIHDIEAIYKMIKDIATFASSSFALGNTTPFEHFFDKNYERIESNKKNLITNSERVYKQNLINKYIKGLEYKERQNI